MASQYNAPAQPEQDELGPIESYAQQEDARAEQEALAARLDALSLVIAKHRSDAIAARQESGIEDVWTQDEEYYEGIDDANRDEAGQASTWHSKPPGRQSAEDDDTSSTVFVNITAPYVETAAARTADMLLPTDDRSWEIKAGTIPELVGLAKGQVPPAMIRQAAQRNPGNAGAAQAMLDAAKQEAAQMMEDAKEKAKNAQKRIEDWQNECGYHGEVRQVIEDAARIGTGILKGPVPMKKKEIAFLKESNGIEIRETLKPGSRRIDAWNLFPDGSCGENIHHGSYIFERDEITRKILEGLKGGPGYIDSQIDKCLEEGPTKAAKEAPEKPNAPKSEYGSKRFEIWYYYGTLDREDLEAIGCDCQGKEKESLPAVIEMVNNHVIKVILNPLDTGDFPYDVMVWKRRAGHWAGIGVGREVRTPQDIVNGSARMLMDNAGRAGGPQLFIHQGKVTPANGIYEVTPWKVWLGAEDMDLSNADKAFRFEVIPMVQAELTEIIKLGLKLAEDSSGMPLLMQGQQGTAPDTLGVAQILNNNSGTVMRRLARLYDVRVTEPHIRRYYTFLLQYGEDSEKGDFNIDARGSSALVERDLQNQIIMQMGAMVANPIYGKDPKKWMDEFLKSQRLDPKRFDYDDEQWRQIVENMAKGPQDPRLAVEQIRSQMQERLKQMEGQFKLQLQQFEQQFIGDQNERDRQIQLIVAGAEQQGQKFVSLTALKSALATTTLKTDAQERMAHVHASSRLIGKTAVEPPGKAPAGQSFQK